MQWETFGKWNVGKEKIQEKLGRLTDEDVDSIGGDHDVLVGKIREKYGYTREKAEREIDEWLKNDLEGDAETDAPVRGPRNPRS